MIILFNIIVLGFIALIAYWWANEGLFSAILHLVCVIISGSIAIGFWEPITMSIMNGKNFDNYLWGVVLLGTFSILLFCFRMASDKIAPANIQFPAWANYSFGAIAGAAAGILTVGICLIGVGFMQSSNQLLDYRGYGRDNTSRGNIGPIGEPLWLNAPKFTSDFFSMISVGSFKPDFTGEPLKHYNPDLYKLSTLVRDSFDGGKGQLSLAPNAAKVTTLAQSDDGLFVIQVSFHSSAKDFGGQLILSNAQVRLIGKATNSNKPDTLHPIAWKQEVKDAGEQLFRFDDISHYATSVPGRQETSIKFVFDAKQLGGNLQKFTPRFLQVRGTRLNLPNMEPTVMNSIAAKQYRGQELTDEEILDARDPLGKDIQHLVEISSRIRNLRISTNGIPGSIEVNEDNFLVEGDLTTVWTQQGVSQGLVVKGIQANPGTAIVQVEISKGTNAAFDDLISVIPQDSAVSLIDDKGYKYAPIGYYIDDGKRMQLTLTPSTPMRTIGDLPMHVLTSSSSKKMYLVFQVTEKEWIKELRVGDHTIGTCNLLAERKTR